MLVYIFDSSDLQVAILSRIITYTITLTLYPAVNIAFEENWFEQTTLM